MTFQSDWIGVSNQPWAKALIIAHCKINAGNWIVWEAMHQQHGDKLIGLAQMLPPDRRWPDKVEAYIVRIAEKNTNRGRIKAALAEEGCIVDDAAMDQWFAMLRTKMAGKTIEQIIAKIKYITREAAIRGHPIKWPADAGGWL